MENIYDTIPNLVGLICIFDYLNQIPSNLFFVNTCHFCLYIKGVLKH